jgi:hypothetical protein
VWAIAEREWNTGGTKPSGSRREKSRSIGIRIRESRSAESRGSCGRVAEHKVGPAWSTGGHVLPGDRVNIPLNSRISGIRGIGG